MMNILLMQEEMLRKTQSFERMKEEAQKCLQQTERFKNEKMQFEIDVFKKVWQCLVYDDHMLIKVVPSNNTRAQWFHSCLVVCGGFEFKESEAEGAPGQASNIGAQD